VFARPEYHWVERRHPMLWLSELWNRLVDWFNGLAGDHPTAFTILISLLVIALVAVLVHLGYVVWRILRPTAATGGSAAPGAAPLLRDARSHLARADALARAGRYAEALGHQFLAVVLELEQANAARFNASKTPAEYVGEVRLDDAGRTTFAGLVASLYRHLFGAVPCDEAEYLAFGATAQQVTRHVLPA
jgi:hypothetical protein